MYNKFADLCTSFDANAGLFPKPFPKGGVGLGNTAGLKSALVLNNPNADFIGGVPVDIRQYC